MKKVIEFGTNPVEISIGNRRISTALLGRPHDAYTITVSRNGKRFSFTFHNSVVNSFKYEKDLTELMILGLQSEIDDSLSYAYNQNKEDFADEFGYVGSLRKNLTRAYNGCKRAHENLNRLFGTPEDIRDFYEILENMREELS